MKGVLTKIKPMHAPLIPPTEAEPQNVLVRGGQMLFRQMRRMARSVPLFVKDGNGNTKLDETGAPVRAYAKNPMTAEPLYPKRKHELFNEEQLYTLESQGNFNVEKVPYRYPTPDELAAEKRTAAVAAMGGGQLGEALVDMGLLPQEVIQRLMGAPVAPVAEAGSTLIEYPIAGERAGQWVLSNGESMKGTKREATEAERALHEPLPEM